MNTIEVSAKGTVELSGKTVFEQNPPNGVFIAVKWIGCEPWAEILVHEGVLTIKTKNSLIELQRV